MRARRRIKVGDLIRARHSNYVSSIRLVIGIGPEEHLPYLRCVTMLGVVPEYAGEIRTWIEAEQHVIDQLTNGWWHWL